MDVRIKIKDHFLYEYVKMLLALIDKHELFNGKARTCVTLVNIKLFGNEIFSSITKARNRHQYNHFLGGEENDKNNNTK